MVQDEQRDKPKLRSKAVIARALLLKAFTDRQARTPEQIEISGKALRRALDQAILDDFPELTQEELDEFMKGA